MTRLRPAIRVAIRRMAGNQDLALPSYETEGAAGMDLRAAVRSPVRLAPGMMALVPCGFALAVPPGYEAQLRPRSGLAAKFGITLVNSPGTIDSDYRGEVMVVLINLGGDTFEVTRGLRIAQMILAPVSRVDWNEVEHLEPSGRSGGGFGHTGT